jgi:NDP-sugar pyrophosphorylase family protein
MSKQDSERYIEKNIQRYLKYELTEETRYYKGQILKRIRALKDIPRHGVKKGDLGGWVFSPYNLSNKGDCWIKDDAKVFARGEIKNHALVSECAEVKGRACIMGQAVVKGFAKVDSHSRVMDEAEISDFALVYGSAKVKGKSKVCERAKVCADSVIDGDVVINGNMVIAEIDENKEHPKAEGKNEGNREKGDRKKAGKNMRVIHGYYGDYEYKEEE